MIAISVIIDYCYNTGKNNKISKKQVYNAFMYYQTYSRADAAVTPTYDEIIVTPTTTTTGVPIYDTPMELQTNTAYDRPVINKDIINVHNNDAYGQIMM